MGGFKALGLSLDRLTRVVVTHAHPDHSGGLGELVSGREIRVAAHRLEAEIISGDTSTAKPAAKRHVGSDGTAPA